MDSSGRSIANVHNGDTFINGSLTVQEQILVGDAEGKSEYLDSGDYTPTITSLTAGWTFSQTSPTTRQAWYVKNGNIVSIGINMFASWVAPTTTVASFRITVPSEDLFEQKLTNQARSTASILGRYTVATTNKSALLEDSYDVVFNAVDFFTSSSNTGFQLLMTYKLEGEDKPASAIISGGGGTGGDVRNPMIENLDGGGFNISNVDTLTVNNIVSSGLVTNPLNSDLNANDFKISACSELASANGDLMIKGLTTGGTFPANILFEGFAVDLSQCPSGLNMGTHRIDDCSEIIGTAGSGLRLDGALVDCKTDLNMNENKIFQLGFIENAGIDLEITSNIGLNGNLNMGGNDITSAPRITNTGGINITAGLPANSNISITSSPIGEVNIGNSCLHKYITQTATERKIIQSCDRLELDNSSGSVETVHIYDANGFFEESTITEGGFDFYQLQDNVTYVIHGDVTVTQGFKFGINNVIKGESLSASITFDETSANIIGFKAVDQNLIISYLTVYGGGGHFSDSNVGLFSATNFNTGASAPFYGRNKRFFIDTCNIFFPFSLGTVRGFGTSNVLSSFFNGGGGSASGIYTNFGLSIADGLSCEIRGNKFVLFKGAQASSTLKMINFADATLTPVVLGFNAVNVVSNIIHPRDEETGIDFSENSLTKLGVISGNTFIRTGGVAPLINYQRAETFDNYNVKAIETYEISGNIGVIDSEPVLECSCGINNSVSSATYIDLDIPITSINPMNMSKRFAYKFVATGVSGGGGAYTKGNYLVSVTDTSKYGYIVDVETVLTGTDILYIVDMTGVFPNLTNYKEQDAGLVDTGILV